MNYSEESSKETAADETTAILVLYEKVIDETGGITELVIWRPGVDRRDALMMCKV